MSAPDAPRVVIAGAGRFGTLHARVWSEAGAQVVGVVDAELARADLLAETYGAVAGTILSEVVARSGARIVVVASDESTHSALADEALRSGCHVFVEKPYAMSGDAARATAALADQLGLCTFAGHVSRFTEASRYTREAVTSGRLGDLWALRLRRDFSREWFADFGDRVHPVWESCVHDIDLAIYLAANRPRRVVAFQSRAAGVAAPSVVSAILEFDSGVIATVESAWSIPERGPQTLAGALALDGTIAAECEVVGSSGTIRQRLVADSLVEWNSRGVWNPDLSLWPETGGRIGGALRDEVAEALAVFTGGKESAVMPTRDAIWGVLVAQAILRSLESGLPEVVE